MKDKTILFIIGGLVLLGLIIDFGRSNNNIGSVSQASEYKFATTTSAITKQLKTSVSTLGSVVINATSTPGVSYLKIWNATSTLDIASSTVLNFVAGTPVGTYTYDVIFNRGIIIESGGGFNGSYTVTYR